MSLKRLKLETSNSVCMLIMASPSPRTTNCFLKGRGHCHVTALTFGICAVFAEHWTALCEESRGDGLLRWTRSGRRRPERGARCRVRRRLQLAGQLCASWRKMVSLTCRPKWFWWQNGARYPVRWWFVTIITLPPTRSVGGPVLFCVLASVVDVVCRRL